MRDRARIPLSAVLCARRLRPDDVPEFKREYPELHMDREACEAINQDG